MLRRIVLLAAVVLAVTACGDDTSSSPVAAASGAASAVPDALRVERPTVGGGSIDLSATAHRPTAFWFWAPG